MSLHRILQPGNFAEMVCGTSFYMAPEILQFQRYNEKVGTLLPSIKFLLAVIIALYVKTSTGKQRVVYLHILCSNYLFTG